ncbi:MAG: hypothetical protein HYR67_07380 [Bacteroidetes bacterium]|nr:hypothetical protein [Bacteroidota bacterium]
MINQIAEEKVIPPHAARLTGSIMSKIAQPSKRAFGEWIIELLLSKRSKFALSGLSSVLLFVFCFQFFDDPAQFKASQASSLTNSVILNAKLFRENFSRHKEKRTLFADCRSPFQSNQYYLNCVKTKLK